MTFMQVIDLRTDRVDDMSRLMDRWVERTHGKRTATHSIVAQDRADAQHVVEIVEFPSYEEAMRNSALPETDRIFQEMVELCEEPPTFTDLDVVRDEQLHKAMAERFITRVMNRREYEAAEELCTAGYQEHDPANGVETLGLQEAIADAARYLDAFRPEFTVESQIAEGDLVTTRWTSHGRHTGTFEDLEPTDRELTVTGHTTFRFEEGRIAESWWNWDLLGMLRQLGVVELPGR
ncbi:ester cyclase [Streptomyces sp. ACA25]|uniref:ester cyclase n=1 Tax=Streptomyces sp. ACA25 TaxID=3022596 RepID=UPI00230701B1|nr:ester cyclase [Streptomyces sp. ACA25]MDB1087411.1 ester cyclase [Streptomyces sp. ACA25]